MSEKQLVTLVDETYHQENRNDMELLFVIPLSFSPRFLHISEQIFEQLDNKSLANCREVAKSWQECIDIKKLSWNRIITLPRILAIEDTYLQVAAKHGQIEVYKKTFENSRIENPKNKNDETPARAF